MYEILKNGSVPDQEMKLIIDNINSRLGYLSHFDEYMNTLKIIQDNQFILNNFNFTDNLSKSIIKK